MTLKTRTVVAAGTILLSCQTLAQTEEPTLEEAIVSASPHSGQAGNGRATNVIAGDELQREAASTLGETLKNELGIQSSSFGPGVGVPVIRGQSSARVEVLQNNSRIGDASDTSADHAVGTETFLADRIEVLRGPATVRFGNGAIGGVVNVLDGRIHTERLEGVDGKVEARFTGNNNESVLTGRLDAGFENWVIHIDGVTRDGDEIEIPGVAQLGGGGSDGIIENSDLEADSGSIGLSWIGDQVKLGLSVNQLDSNYGIPPELPEPGEEAETVRIDLEQTTIQGKAVIEDIGSFWQTARLDLSYTDYQHEELEIEDDEVEVGTLIENNTFELRAEATHGEETEWLGAIGLQYRTQDFVAEGEEAFVQPSQTNNLGIYVLEEKTFGGLQLELGARLDRQEVDPEVGSDIDHTSFTLSGAVSFNLTDEHLLTASISRAERAPAAEELLSDGVHVATSSFELGDPELDEETSLNLELRWQYQGNIDVTAAIFHNQFDDFIFLANSGLVFDEALEESGAAEGFEACVAPAASTSGTGLGCFIWSQNDARFTGGEIEVGVPLNDNQALRFWGDFVFATLNGGDAIPRIPPARIGASWRYNRDSWSSGVSLVHAFEQNRAGTDEPTTDDYTRIDADVTYKYKSWSVFLKASNLNDAVIRNATSFLRDIAPEAGRAITIGANFTF